MDVECPRQVQVGSYAGKGEVKFFSVKIVHNDMEFSHNVRFDCSYIPFERPLADSITKIILSQTKDAFFPILFKHAMIEWVNYCEGTGMQVEFWKSASASGTLTKEPRHNRKPSVLISFEPYTHSVSGVSEIALEIETLPFLTLAEGVAAYEAKDSTKTRRLYAEGIVLQ